MKFKHFLLNFVKLMQKKKEKAAHRLSFEY